MGNIKGSVKGFMSPAKYIQGPGQMDLLDEYCQGLGRKAVAFIDAYLYDGLSKKLDGIFTQVELVTKKFSGQVSLVNAEKYVKMAGDAEIVIGVGGGRTMDMAKIVANEAKKCLVIVPTAASTDAPTSALSVIYTEEGAHSHEIFYDKGPDLVVVDTALIASAPVRLLVAGMGDALATFFEARACMESDSTNNMKGGFKRTIASYAIAKECYAVLLRDGKNAKLAAEVGSLSVALDNIIEVNSLLSGIGAECNGASGAHAFHDGFTAIKESADKLHGEKVAFGVLCQLVIENRGPEELKEVLDFSHSVGLPITLEEMGIREVTPEKIKAAAQAIMHSPILLREPFDVTEDMVYATILAADAIGRDYKKAC